MQRHNEVNGRVLHRLKIARGHLDKVIEMVEKDEYCIDVLTQSKAVRSQLSSADTLLLENHLATCVVDDIKNGKIQKAVGEVLKVFEKNEK